MFSRLFGKKKESVPVEVIEEQKEEEKQQKVMKATEAMAEVQKSVMGLETKVEHLQKIIEKDTARAKELRNAGKNSSDPELKPILLRMKQNKKEIERHQNMMFNYQTTIQTIDNAAFIEEMQTILQKTEKALADCASNADEIADLMDKINEHTERINEVMNLLTQRNDEDEEGLDDLLDDLDAEIAKEKAKQSALPLPGAGVLPSAPVAQQTTRTEEDDLEAMLNAL